jgi:hypothetical protein
MMPFRRFYNLIPTGINIPTGNQREELHDGIDADSTWERTSLSRPSCLESRIEDRGLPVAGRRR